MSQWMTLAGLALVYAVLLAASAWRARLIGRARRIPPAGTRHTIAGPCTSGLVRRFHRPAAAIRTTE